MSEFPTEDEEFELMYGDEYDLIKQQEGKLPKTEQSKSSHCIF